MEFEEDAQNSDYAIIYNTLQKDQTNTEKEAVEYNRTLLIEFCTARERAKTFQ